MAISMNDFKLEMFTPQKQFFSGRVQQIICQTSAGKLGVLKGHYPMTAALIAGELRLMLDGEWKSAFCSDGFMEVRPDEVLVFSHMCEWPEDIDEALAKQQHERQTEQLRDAESLREYRRSEIELQRMMALLKKRPAHRE